LQVLQSIKGCQAELALLCDVPLCNAFLLHLFDVVMRASDLFAGASIHKRVPGGTRIAA
jgi:hypothetical protein